MDLPSPSSPPAISQLPRDERPSSLPMDKPGLPSPTSPFSETSHPISPFSETSHPISPFSETANPTSPLSPTFHPSSPAFHPSSPTFHPSSPAFHPSTPLSQPSEPRSPPPPAHSGLEVVQPGQRVPHSHYPPEKQHHYRPSAPWYPVQHAPAPAAERGKTICGVRRTTLILGVACVVLLLGTTGASVVAGVTSRTLSQTQEKYTALKQSKSSTLPSSSCPSQTPFTTPSPTSSTATPTGSSASPAPTETGMTSIPLPQEASPIQGVGRLNCPGLDPQKSTYSVPGAPWLRFRRECGMDFGGGDLGRVPLTRMEDCLNLCAALRFSVQSTKGPCVGVVWTTPTRPDDPEADVKFCWLKSSKNSGRTGRPEAEAAWIMD